MTLFGGNDPQFRNMLTSLLTMVRWTVGNLQYERMAKCNQITTWIYTMSFVILVRIMLMFSFHAIMINTFDMVKQIVMIRPSQFGVVIKLFFRDLYDLLCRVACDKRKQRDSIDLDAKGEYETDQHIDPRQAAEMAAMRRMEHK